MIFLPNNDVCTGTGQFVRTFHGRVVSEFAYRIRFVIAAALFSKILDIDIPRLFKSFIFYEYKGNMWPNHMGRKH